MTLHYLSTARLDLYSLGPHYSLPRKCCRNAFPSFVNRTVLRPIAETSCATEHPLAFEAIGSDPRLRYIQVMITRLLLSLKKAVTLQKHGWSFGEPTTHTTMRFAERRDGIITRDVIRLDTFASTQEGTPRKSGVTV